MARAAHKHDREEHDDLFELDPPEDEDSEYDLERWRDVVTVAMAALALVMTMALLSYDGADVAGQVIQGDGDLPSTQNWVGKPGAYIAYGAFSLFGWCAYLLPAPLMLFVVARWCPSLGFADLEDSGWPEYAGCTMVLLGSASGLSLIPVLWAGAEAQELSWEAGGMLGFFMAHRLLELGPGGALVIELSLIMMGLLLATPSLLWRCWKGILGWFAIERFDCEEIVQELEPFESPEAGRAVMPAYDANSLPELRIIGDDEPAEKEDISRLGDGEIPEQLPPLREAETPEPPTRRPPKAGITEDVTEDEDPTKLPPIETHDEVRIITNEEEPVFEGEMGINLVETPDNDSYQLPPIGLLHASENTRPELARDEILHNSNVLEQTLKDFGIAARVVEVNYGPTITCYELEPAPGIKISRIENLANDITRSLRACSVRIVAPIPGKGTVGVEVPNRHRQDVLLRDLLCSETYRTKRSPLRIGLGKTISGEPFVFDLAKAPHLLVAGATGSGKSVCINSIITSLLYNAAPHEVKLLLVDPKQVELALYRDIPHLLSPVVTEPRRAGAALRWAVEEMEQRYRYLKKLGVRNIAEYNEKRKRQQTGELQATDAVELLPGYLPFIVVIIDELADLMMVVRAEVESMIARLAAMARAVGIHLVLATQRPSVDVLTGVIKNNFPARVAFQVSAMADSRTILDIKGAESLMGRGDMLLSTGGAARPARLQGAFISTEEIDDVVAHVKDQQEVDYVQEEFTPLEDEKPSSDFSDFEAGDDYDELYDQGVQIVLENDSASTSLLQRRMKIGYGRAARLLDMMEEKGIVGPPRGSKPRLILMNRPV